MRGSSLWVVLPLFTAGCSGEFSGADDEAASASKPGGGTATTAVLLAAPNPSVVGRAYSLDGTNLAASRQVKVSLCEPIVCSELFVDANSAGAFTLTRTASATPGIYTFRAYQVRAGRWSLRASASLIVQPALCGDLVCDLTETPGTCGTDCSACGDGLCTGAETPTKCPADCGACNKSGLCDAGESSESCPFDCPTAGWCNKSGLCDAGETYESCPFDCSPAGWCNKSGTCDPGETSATCPFDCPLVGWCNKNGICEGGETTATCPFDCT